MDDQIIDLVDQPELEENDSAKEFFEDLANNEIDSNIYHYPYPLKTIILIVTIIIILLL